MGWVRQVGASGAAPPDPCLTGDRTELRMRPSRVRRGSCSQDAGRQSVALSPAEFLHEESVCNAVQSARTYEAPCSLSHEATLEISRKKRAFREKLSFVRTELNKVLHIYCSHHPWEPSYQLDIICGVYESNSWCSPKLYHANFLASRYAAAADGGISLPRERTLFFAELWESNWYPYVSRSNSSSSCCPVYDYHASVGHYCPACERAPSKIVHPPSGNHSGNEGADSIRFGEYEEMYNYVTSILGGDCFENLLESDYIYFDPHRDVDLARLINFVSTPEMYYPLPNS